MSPPKVGYASPKPAISGWIDTIKVRIKMILSILVLWLVMVVLVVVLGGFVSIGFSVGFGGTYI